MWLGAAAAAIAQRRQRDAPIDGPQGWQRPGGKVGDLIIVEGQVVRIDYVVRGNPRRYVISTADARVVYEGPALPVGWFGFVRFTATILSQEHTDTGEVKMLVDNARDVVVIRKPGESHRKISRQIAGSPERAGRRTGARGLLTLGAACSDDS